MAEIFLRRLEILPWNQALEVILRKINELPKKSDLLSYGYLVNNPPLPKHVIHARACGHTIIRVTHIKAQKFGARCYGWPFCYGKQIRDASFRQAKKEIADYIKSKGRAWTSEIADDLMLDLEICH